jgi:hypothetical protein
MLPLDIVRAAHPFRDLLPAANLLDFFLPRHTILLADAIPDV